MQEESEAISSIHPLDLSKILHVYAIKQPLKKEEESKLYLQLGERGSLYPLKKQRIYLAKENKGLVFSEDCTRLCIFPKNEDKGFLSIEQTIVVDNRDSSRTLCSNFSMPIKKYRGERFLSHSLCQVLKKSFYLGRDQIAKHQGRKVDIIVIDKQHFFLDTSEYLTYIEGKWKKFTGERGEVLSRAGASNDKGLFIEVWGKNLQEYGDLFLYKQNGSTRVIKYSDLLTDIHMRSAQKVSCYIEKQLFFLKEGDVVYKKQGKWHLSEKIDNEAKMYLLIKKIEKKESLRTISGSFVESDRVSRHDFSLDITKGSFRGKSGAKKRRDG